METNNKNSSLTKKHRLQQAFQPEAHSKVTLIWDNITIRTLQDLREHFNPEELLKAHIRNDLYYWLIQHYYEYEADAVQHIKIDEPECIHKLCSVLGIDYPTTNCCSSENNDLLEAKKELLRKYTSDETIIHNISTVAMNQEELAELLNQDKKVIYLCENNFSIPASRSGVKYIGVGTVIIDNAFTQEQYEKAGITLEGISLPKEASYEINKLAYEAACQNGYDDFAEHHTPLASAYHQKLATRKISTSYRLPYNASIVTKQFTSKSECEKALNNCIDKAYREAEKHFDTEYSICIANEAADYYKNCIEQAFMPSLDALKTLCNITVQTECIKKLQDKVCHCRRYLKEKFVQELYDSADYYKMYDINYFRNQADITKSDNRIYDDGFFKLLESTFSNHIQYSITDVYSPIKEMENDLNERGNAFFNTAYTEYKDFAGEIETLLDEIGQNFPKLKENESITEYIERCCVISRMR